MDALKRVLSIGREPPSERWTTAQFGQAAVEGKRRYVEVEELFGVQYSMFRDVVALIAPDFKLATEEEQAARSVVMSGGRWIALSFVRWERCSATAGLPNPYEPWIEIWEHGGSFSVEHGRFVDVYDSAGIAAGAVVVRRA